MDVKGSDGKSLRGGDRVLGRIGCDANLRKSFFPVGRDPAIRSICQIDNVIQGNLHHSQNMAALVVASPPHRNIDVMSDQRNFRLTRTSRSKSNEHLLQHNKTELMLDVRVGRSIMSDEDIKIRIRDCKLQVKSPSAVDRMPLSGTRTECNARVNCAVTTNWVHQGSGSCKFVEYKIKRFKEKIQDT